MSDRLQELLRQRALVEEHLAWLDGEIAAAGGESADKSEAPLWPAASPAKPASPNPAVSALTATPPAVALPSTPALPPEVAKVADQIIEEYRVEPKALHTDVRKGCLLYFFAALGLVILGAVGFYFAYHHE